MPYQQYTTIGLLITSRPKNFVERFFASKLCPYLPTPFQSFELIKNNALFIEKYLDKGDCVLCFHDLAALLIESKKSQNEILDSARMKLIDRVYDMQENIKSEFFSFKARTKDPGMSEKIRVFFREVNPTSSAIVSKMITEGIKTL